MPTFEVTAPDGTKYEVNGPEGSTEHEALAQVMKAHAPAPAVDAPDVSMGSRLLRGMGDPIGGLVQFAAHLAPANDETRFLDKTLANSEQAYQGARQAAGQTGMDVPRTLGNIASPANMVGGEAVSGADAILAAAPKLAANTLARRGVKLAAGAIGGAVSGASMPVLKGADNSFWDQKGQQAEIGGVAGGTLPIITHGISLAVAPKVSAGVKTLMDAGIPLTPGMTFGGMIKAGEDKLSSLPILGDLIKNGQRNSVMGLNTAVLSSALKPIGQTLPKSLPAGREAVDYVANRITDRYDNLLPKLTGALDQQLQQDITSVATNAIGDGAKQETLDRFKNIIKSQIADRAQNGTLTGDALKSAQQNLGNLARKYGASQNADDQALGDMVSDAQQHFNDMLERVNPGFQGQLRDVNKAFAQYSRIRRAAGSLGNKDGVFSPPQLANAVKAGDSSAGKGNFARGKAFGQDISDPANQIMPSTVPDSGTPGRLMMAALLGGHAAVNPGVGTAGILGSLLYTRAGQKALGAYASPGLIRSGLGTTLRQNSLIPSTVLSGLIASGLSQSPSP